MPIREHVWTKWKLSLAKFKVLRNVSLYLSGTLGAAALSQLPASLQRLTLVSDKHCAEYPWRQLISVQQATRGPS